MTSLLALDLGNTAGKVYTFIDDQLICSQSLLNKDRTLLSYLEEQQEQYSLNKLAYCSVNSVTEKILLDFLTKYDFHTLKVNYQSRLNFSFKLHSPQTVGADRLAALAGAVSEADSACDKLIIHLGTALVIDYLNNQNEHVGGMIFPGPKAFLMNLADIADKITAEEVCAANTGESKAVDFFGEDTVEAVKYGNYQAYLSVCNHYVNSLEQQLQRQVKVLLTGGAAQQYLQSFNFEHTYHIDLVAHGLKTLYELNNHG